MKFCLKYIFWVAMCFFAVSAQAEEKEMSRAQKADEVFVALSTAHARNEGSGMGGVEVPQECSGRNRHFGIRLGNVPVAGVLRQRGSPVWVFKRAERRESTSRPKSQAHDGKRPGLVPARHA